MYIVIASANVIIAIDGSTLDGDIDEFNDYKGQALTIRALAHFDALKLFGQQNSGGTLGIPYIKTYKGEDLFPSRNTVEECKNFIIQDLKDAKALMSSDYDDDLGHMVNSEVPDALLSRVYLYFGMYNEAKAVMDTHKYSVISKSNYVSSFSTDGSPNTIFALAFSDTDNNSNNGLGYIYKGDTYGDIEVLQNAADLFDTGDVRGNNSNGIIGMEDSKIRNLGKFASLNGYDDVNIIRYEEVLLNYAEASFETGASADALTQLNLITTNRGASTYTGTITKNYILNERRKELMFEGFRFDDLMRNQKILKKLIQIKDLIQLYLMEILG